MFDVKFTTQEAHVEPNEYAEFDVTVVPRATVTSPLPKKLPHLLVVTTKAPGVSFFGQREFYVDDWVQNPKAVVKKTVTVITKDAVPGKTYVAVDVYPLTQAETSQASFTVSVD